MQADLPTGNRAFSSILAIEFNVERVIQKHSARVEQARAGAENAETTRRTPSSQKPGRQAVGPNGWEIRDPPENEKRADHTK
jgi:hypothetical protein